MASGTWQNLAPRHDARLSGWHGRDADSWHNLFYTGADDPRACVVIGEDSKPHLFCVETTHGGSRTTIQKNNRDVVATIDWSAGDHLGRVTIGARHLHASQLLAPGSSSSARAFPSTTGKKCEWRRGGYDNLSYDLYAGSHVIATYRRFTRGTSVGPSHGILEYIFDHDAFLVEVIVTLCLNRHLDAPRAF